MKITKHTTKDFYYYECNPMKGTTLFAFSKRQLLKDLFNVYQVLLLPNFNLN